MENPQEPYTLYHNYWSSCSLMVRMTLELGKQPPNIAEVPVIEKEIDIQHGGQLVESFMCEVNRLGTVPAFTHPRLLGAPITESLDITRLIHQRFYPHLCPKEHQLEIEKLLGQLHQIIFVTLSFRKWPERREQIINGAKSKLKDPNLSQRHREALEYKVSQQTPLFRDAFAPETIEIEDAKTKALFEKLAEIKKKYGNSTSLWLFGREYGTSLDAHALILLARIKDVGLEKLVHPDMLAYGKAVMEGDMWKNFMQGRSTMHIPEGSDY